MNFCLLILQEDRLFVSGFLSGVREIPDSLRNVLIGDEAVFALNGEVNTHNVVHYGPAGQPPVFNFETKMSREKVTVCVGLCGNGVIIGPFFFERNVNG